MDTADFHPIGAFWNDENEDHYRIHYPGSEFAPSPPHKVAFRICMTLA